MLVIENCNSLSDLRQKLIDGEEVRTARYEPCEDAIKREDALRAFMYATNGERLPDYDCDNYPVTYDLRCIKKTLRALPSVNPQAKTGHWIALEEWKKDFKEYVNSLSMLRDDYKGIMEYIDELPVTPQQKIGKWILSGGYWRCSECKEKALLKLDKSKGNCKEYMPIRSDFCPNCGIKMQEVEE